MAIDRLERVNALLRREIGEALYRVFAGEDIDIGAITVTNVRTARNLRNATVEISIFGHDDERRDYMRKLAGKARELQAIINRDLTLKYTPRLRFMLTESIEMGDHVLGVLSQLDIPDDDDVSEMDGPQD